MNFILLHQTIADGDAIGHDIQCMYSLLYEKGYEVNVFCENLLVDGKLNIINIEDLKKVIKNKQSIIIYHHSIYWKLGEELLRLSQCNVIIRYHNITPPTFFESYSEAYKNQTALGREQTKRLASNPNFFYLSDSDYNNDELISFGAKRENTAILAPLHKIEMISSLTRQQDDVISLLEKNGCVNVLFVGRVAPNKGHLNICHVVNAYKKLFDDKIKFWIIGGFDQEINSYNMKIEELIKEFQLAENIVFTNKISIETLKSFFIGCDIFVCLSEHEGFGVPLIESQFFQLPVVALNRAAVKETLGSNQLVVDQFNPEYFASAINTISSNKEIHDFLIANGYKNYIDRFSFSILSGKFNKIIDEYSQTGAIK